MFALRYLTDEGSVEFGVERQSFLRDAELAPALGQRTPLQVLQEFGILPNVPPPPALSHMW